MTISASCLFSDISNQLAVFSPGRKVTLSWRICQGFHLKEFLHLICHNKALLLSLENQEREQEKKIVIKLYLSPRKYKSIIVN